MFRRRFLKTSICCGFSLLTTTSCDRFDRQNRIQRQFSKGYRPIRHSLGITYVPNNPQRIIALDDSVILDPLIALGIQPIASTTYWTEKDILFRGLSKAETDGIETVGSILQPSLEKILKLKPDLILARESLHPFNLLSKIAPTVIIDRSKFEKSFKDNFLFVADVVDRRKQAQQVLDRYAQRVENLRNILKPRLDNLTVSVIGYNYSNENSFFVSNTDAIYHQVLKDIGLQVIPRIKNQTEYSLNFSIESLDLYDADVLFAINYSKIPLENFLKKPLWKTLKSFKAKRIYEVKPDIWSTFGPLGVDKIINDLYRSFIPKSIAL